MALTPHICCPWSAESSPSSLTSLGPQGWPNADCCSLTCSASHRCPRAALPSPGSPQAPSSGSVCLAPLPPCRPVLAHRPGQFTLHLLGCRLPWKGLCDAPPASPQAELLPVLCQNPHLHRPFRRTHAQGREGSCAHSSCRPRARQGRPSGPEGTQFKTHKWFISGIFYLVLQTLVGRGNRLQKVNLQVRGDSCTLQITKATPAHCLCASRRPQGR